MGDPRRPVAIWRVIMRGGGGKEYDSDIKQKFFVWVWGIDSFKFTSHGFIADEQP
jgi:hypothetical protein